ncbi:MAG: hypothetical protein FAF05_02365 [Epsilonproteobacteria bacterium]|nr:hypothetical protein [Campylobacterota bacterium]
MSVIFQATVLENDTQDNWMIELRDMTDNRVALCGDMQEFQQKMEEFAEDYGGSVDEVVWKKQDNLPEHYMDAIRLEMAKMQAQIEEELGEALIKES